MRKLVPLLFAVLFLATGCKNLAARIPLPPTYDEQCIPTDDRFVKWSEDEQDLAKPGTISSDPQKAYDDVQAFFKEKNIKLVPKGTYGPQQWSRFTTTLPEVIFLGKEFDDYSIKAKSVILWHEAAHVRQWERLGPEDFIARYAVTEGRWSLEVVAYRESFRTMKLFGATEEQMREAMAERLNLLYEEYILYQMPKKCMEKYSLAVWELEL